MGNQAITTEKIDGISVRSNEHKLCTLQLVDRTVPAMCLAVVVGSKRVRKGVGSL